MLRHSRSMPTPDAPTLFLVHGVVALTLGAMLLAFWRTHRAMSCLALWALGIALLGLGTLLLGFRQILPAPLAAPLGNSLIIAGALAVWNGIRLFNGRPARWGLALVLWSLITSALVYFGVVSDVVAYRLIITSGAVALLCAAASDELFRFGPRPLTSIVVIAGVPLMLDTLALVMQIGWVAFHPLGSPAALTSAGGTPFLLIPIAANIVMVFGFVVMTAERSIQQQLALEARLYHSQKLEALGTLAGGIAHDLNNTLVPIVALTKSTAGRLPAQSRERKNLETVLQASERAGELVKQILAFSRERPVEKQELDLRPILQNAVDMLRATLPSTIRIQADFGPAPHVFADAGQMHQVVINLATNALQAIGAAMGMITLRLDAERPPAHAPAAAAGRQDWLHLGIADTGCGMSEAVRERIFEPFFTTKPVGRGTGLGLSVVHGIITNHGGHIIVESRLGHGTRFDIYLPGIDAKTGAARADTVPA